MWPKANFDQISKFHFLKFWQIASCESTGRELSFEWDIIGFRLQSQKLELPHKTLSNTLAVKGLITNIKFNFGNKDQGYKIEGPDLKRI